MTSLRPSPIRCPNRLFFTLWACVLVLSIPALFGSPATRPSERMPLSPHSLLLDIAIAGEEIIVVGERGHILKSKDQGESWRQVTTPTQATLTNLTFINGKQGWAAGHFGVILATNNGGDSWELISVPDSEVSFFDTLFFDEANGLFVGSYGQYSKTEDGGVTLENEYINDLGPHFYSIKQNATGTLYLAGEMGQIQRSNNQGRDWETLTFPYEGSLFDVLCLDETTVLAFGLRGHIFRSPNNGDQWEEIPNDEPEMLTSGIVLSSGTILLTSIADKVLMSNDGGSNFYPVQQPHIDGTVAVAESRSGEQVYFCGRHGFLSVDREQLETSLRNAATQNE